MKLRALDLFCCAGGASLGLERAGFEVHGVDIEPQPDYPFRERFTQANVLDLTPEFIAKFDLVWASPPCQKFTAYRRKNPTTIGASALNLIPETRALLEKSGRPFIIENVEGAKSELRNPTLLCGSMFGLDVRRHRLFETTFLVRQPACRHESQTPRFTPASNRANKRSTCEIGVWRIPLEVQCRAMDIYHMPVPKLSQAIPPAFSEYLGRSWLAYVGLEFLLTRAHG